MKDMLIRSFLFFAVIALFIAASSINTSSNSLGDNNRVPPNVAKYLTPHGAGDHSGSSWSNAYSFQEMLSYMAANTNYFLIDSTFSIDSFPINNLDNISFIGKGKTKTIIQGQTNPFNPDPLLWSIEGFDLDNADNITIRGMQIRKFRGFGIRVDAASSYFFAYNDSIVNCGWAAFGDVVLVDSISAPSGVKLLGDDATFRRCYVMYSGWDGMQVGAYRIAIDSTIIYATGQDPNVISQGDGIGAVVNKDSSYYVHINETDSIIVYKSAQFTVNNCDINTVDPIKSGIEAGEKDSSKHSEKPLVQIYNSKITGGKGVGITQDANPRIGHFYSSIENCKIKSLDPSKPTFRIDSYDPSPYETPQWGSIKNNTFYSPLGYDPFPEIDDCPVAEYYTESTAVLYVNNKWKVNNVDSVFCVIHNAELED